MSFKIGDKVRCKITKDEGTITSFNDLTISVYWTKGQDIGRHLDTLYSDVELIPHVTFNQRDLQILENELQKLIYKHEVSMRSEKRIAKRFWDMSDKNDPFSEDNFNIFSGAHKQYEHHKAKLNQLAALQAKIKRAKNCTF